MIVKKLRQQRNWSQDQLAQLSGLSIRTIQRIESGNKASMESLKSLASVFEVTIEKLQEEIIVIDKTTEKWKSLPWFLRLNLIGIKTRKDVFLGESFCLALAVLMWLGSFYKPQLLQTAPLMFICAYGFTALLRAGDKHDIW